MSSDQEILRLQQILGVAFVCIALSLGLGGFDNFSAWHEWEMNEKIEREDDYGDYGRTEKTTFVFTLEELNLEWEVDYNDGDSDSSSQDIDYGEYDLFEELEKSMPNIQKGGYLAIALLGFVIWKLQQMKTEVDEEIRKLTFTQIINALKGAGVVVALVLLYHYQNGALEDDFDDFFSETSVDCDDAWINEPEFEWSGDSKFSYDNLQCEDASDYYTKDGDNADIDFKIKTGFFLFASSLAPIFLVFNSLNSNTQLVSFSTPNVPNIQSPITNEQPKLGIKNPFAPKKVIRNADDYDTKYRNPDASVMAIPEDEDD